jgi:hypothetical protein
MPCNFRKDVITGLQVFNGIEAFSHKGLTAQPARKRKKKSLHQKG